MTNPYGMLIMTLDDGRRAFMVANINYIFEDEKEAHAAMDRLNDEWRAAHNAELSAQNAEFAQRINETTKTQTTDNE